MTKKMLALALIASMAFSTTACSSSNASTQTTAEAATEAATTSEAAIETEVTSEIATETEDITTEAAATEAQTTANEILVGTWVYEFEADTYVADNYTSSGVKEGDMLESRIVLTDDNAGVIYLNDTSINETLFESPIDSWTYTESDNYMMINYTVNGESTGFECYYNSEDNTLSNINSEYHKVEE